MILTGDAERNTKSSDCTLFSPPLSSLGQEILLTHETPVAQPEESCLWVKWQAVVGAFGIVVGTELIHAACGGGEAAASDELGCHSGAEGDLSVHL